MATPGQQDMIAKDEIDTALNKGRTGTAPPVQKPAPELAAHRERMVKETAKQSKF